MSPPTAQRPPPIDYHARPLDDMRVRCADAQGPAVTRRQRPAPALAPSWPLLTIAVPCTCWVSWRAARRRRTPTSAIRSSTPGRRNGVFYFWNQSCIPLTAYPNDLSAMMTPDEIAAASSAAAAAWSRDMVACTFIDIQVTQSTAPTRSSRRRRLQRAGVQEPVVRPGRSGALRAEALAITSVWARKTSGTIVDADIEVNADPSLAIAWTDLDVNPTSPSRICRTRSPTRWAISSASTITATPPGPTPPA